MFCKLTTPLSLNNSSSFPFRFITLYLYKLFHEYQSRVITCRTILIIGKWLRNSMIRTFVDMYYMILECMNFGSNLLSRVYSCFFTKKILSNYITHKKPINCTFYENYQSKYRSQKSSRKYFDNCIYNFKKRANKN